MPQYYIRDYTLTTTPLPSLLCISKLQAGLLNGCVDADGGFNNIYSSSSHRSHRHPHHHSVVAAPGVVVPPRPRKLILAVPLQLVATELIAIDGGTALTLSPTPGTLFSVHYILCVCSYVFNFDRAFAIYPLQPLYDCTNVWYVWYVCIMYVYILIRCDYNYRPYTALLHAYTRRTILTSLTESTSIQPALWICVVGVVVMFLLLIYYVSTV